MATSGRTPVVAREPPFNNTLKAVCGNLFRLVMPALDTSQECAVALPEYAAVFITPPTPEIRRWQRCEGVPSQYDGHHDQPLPYLLIDDISYLLAAFAISTSLSLPLCPPHDENVVSKTGEARERRPFKASKPSEYHQLSQRNRIFLGHRGYRQ